MRYSAVALLLLLCLHLAFAASASVKWKTATSSAPYAPVFDSSNVYVATPAGLVFALDRISGARRWSKDMGVAITAQPAAAQLIYIPTANGLSAMDRDGVSRGSFSADAILSQPIVFENRVVAISQDKIYVASTAGDLSDRSKISTITPQGNTDGSATLSGGLLYIGLTDGRLISVDPLSGTQLSIANVGRSIWRSPPVIVGSTIYISAERRVAALSASGVVRWSREFDTWITAPAYSDGVLYVGSNDGNMYAIAAENGEVLWKFSTGGAVRQRPTVGAGTVYIPSQDDSVYAVNSSGQKWKVVLDDWPSELSLTGGMLYTATYSGTATAISTLGCVFRQPEENATIFTPATLGGSSYADSGLSHVEVRVVGGGWAPASLASDGSWDINYSIAAAKDPITAQCRVGDAADNLESEPYSSLSLTFVSSEEQLPRIVVKGPTKVTAGQSFTLKFEDEFSRTLTGVTITIGESRYGDIGGQLTLTAPALGPLILKVSKPNYRAETVTITIERSFTQIIILGGVGLVILLAAVYIYLRSRRWR